MMVVISVACSMFPLQTRYVVCSVDATVWPSSTQYMVDCLTLLQNVCSLSPCNVGHVQTPVFHSATSMQAHMKHSRKVEDVLWKANLDISQRVTLLFSKETTRQGSDKRALTQLCISPFAAKNCKWQESEAHQSGVVGPLPLLKVSEMVGYDADTGMRPGAASRVEQMLGQRVKLNLSNEVLILNGPRLCCFGFSVCWNLLDQVGLQHQSYRVFARKGVQCHRLIVEGYARGMSWNVDKDVMVWLDACPNQ